MRFEVLLATFNGERHLREQLDSILAQQEADFHITARDDGSTDGTTEILREYERNNPERLTIMRDEVKRGYPDCFWYLLREAPDADFYAFCDQDDKWSPHKLTSCEKLCEGTDLSKPVLYFHDYEVGDENLNVYGKHVFGELKYRKEEPYSSIFYVYIQGFSIIVNAALRERVLKDKLPEKYYIAHDKWLFWCGALAGTMVYDPGLHAIYRRHGGSFTDTGKGFFSQIKAWWTEDVRGGRTERWGATARFFADCYEDEIPESTLRRWRLVAGGGKGLPDYLKRLFFPGRLKPSLAGEMILRLSFLLNRK